MRQRKENGGNAPELGMLKDLKLKGSERWGGSLEQRWEELRARSCKTFGHGDVLEFHCK